MHVHLRTDNDTYTQPLICACHVYVNVHVCMHIYVCRNAVKEAITTYLAKRRSRVKAKELLAGEGSASDAHHSSSHAGDVRATGPDDGREGKQ